MRTKKLAVVILNYNTKQLLKQCLDSITDAVNSKSAGGIEIIIVDNGSTDGSRKYLGKLGGLGRLGGRKRSGRGKKLISFKTIFNKENLGFAAGNNAGIKAAIKNGADYVMVLNSDTLAKNDFFSPLVEFMEANQKVGVVGPKVYFAPGFEYHKNRYKKSDRGRVIWSAGGLMDWDNVIGSNRGVNEVDRGQYDKPLAVDMVSGCCLMAPAKVWEQAGFFDERYFMYYEDAAFCQNVLKNGLKVFYVPQARVWHLNAGSSGVGGDLQDYFITRNRLLFGLKWAPLRSRIALLRESWRLLVKGRKWQKMAVKDFYLRRFGKGSWEQ